MPGKKCVAEDSEVNRVNKYNFEGGKVKYRVAILAVAIAFGAIGLQAQMPPKMMCMSDDLKLSEAQQKQMQASIIAEKKELIQMKADLAKAKLELKEIMMADNIDKAAALKKVDQITAAKAAIAKKKLSGKIDRMNILTPEQRQKCCRMPMMMGKDKWGHGGFGKGMKEGRGQEMGRCLKMGHPVDTPDESGKTKDKD